MLSRWISALVATGLLFGTTYAFGDSGLLFISSIIIFVCMYEFTQLFSKSYFWSVLFMGCSVAIYTTHVFNPYYTLPVFLTAFLILSSMGIFFFSNKDTPHTYLSIEWALWGLIYCALVPALTMHITYTVGWKIFYFLLITVFLGDSCALFAGNFLGGKKIIPKISPKKTFSGALGGIVGSCIFGVGFVYFISPVPVDLLQWTGICATIAFFAQCGDFFESMIKRHSGKKDSGQLMPGHGGFLDRIDGVYFGSIILFLYTYVYDLKIFFS